MSDGPTWVKWEAGKWLIGTSELDRLTEFVYFRLCMFAYESGSSLIGGSTARLAMRCKSSIGEFEAALSILVECEKVEIREGAIFIASVARRLEESNSLIAARRVGAAKARRKRELMQDGRSSKEIELMISAEFSDDQSPNRQTDRQTDNIPISDHQSDLLGDQKTDTGNAVQEAVDLWNSLADELSLSKLQVMTDKRKRGLAKRLKECGGIEGWRYALDMVRKSAFLRGKNDRGWKANIDFMLEQSSFTKLMEGAYSDRNGGGSYAAVIDAIGDKNGK